MRRHATDPVSLVFGLLFVGVAVIGVTDVFSLTGTDLRWFGPGLLVLLGLVLVLGAGFGRSRNTDDTTGVRHGDGASEHGGTPEAQAQEVDEDVDGPDGPEGPELSESGVAPDAASRDERPPSAGV